MIRLDNISKTFRDGDTQVQALKNISFEVNKGELVAIIGKSGSGKIKRFLIFSDFSTSKRTAIIILAAKKYLPYRSVKKAKLRNSHIGFVMQDFALVEKVHCKAEYKHPSYIHR